MIKARYIRYWRYKWLYFEADTDELRQVQKETNRRKARKQNNKEEWIKEASRTPS
jgi:hypothetical protein